MTITNITPATDGDFFGPARPLYSTSVQAGFPSPADDYIEQELDLNEKFIQRPAATYFMRVKGDAMTGVGIFEGDTLIVDRSLPAECGRVVVVDFDGDLVVRRVGHKAGGGCTLEAENPAYRPIIVTELMVWGVVTSVIHCL